MKTEKLQKVLARAGLGSRRSLEQWIKDGRVQVDGETATLGDRVGEGASIVVDGKAIQTANRSMRTRVLFYNKPEGEICTRSDPGGRKTVFEQLPDLEEGRWISIGRLDINTSGLMLFTNNGELAHLLMHPSSEIEREYAVRVLGIVDRKILTTLKKGVKLEDGVSAFKSIHDAGGKGANHWYHVVLTQGKNRLVRRLWESQELKVSRLMRVRFGNIALPRNTPSGHCQDLKWIDIKRLESLARSS